MHAGSAAVICPTPASPRRARGAARPAPDLFQACFQGRLLQHLHKQGITETASARLQHSRPGLPGPQRRSSAETVRPGRRQPDPSSSLGAAEAVIPPERLPELARRLTAAGVPPARVQEFMARPQVQEQGVSLAEVGEFFPELAGGRRQGAAPEGPGAGPPGEPAVLAELLELLAASPGGGLKIPGERRPEAQLLLAAAGLSPDQAARLLWHPGTADHGLTPEQVRSLWLQAHTPREAADAGSPTPPAWRQLWQKLQLPAEAWPDLKAALQFLGVSPDQLARLEESAAAGLPLTQVWQLLQDPPGEQDAPQTPEELARGLAERLEPYPHQAAEAWAGLLRQAGLSEEMVARLWGGVSPGSTAELRARLLKLAPEPEPPPAQDSPKPLYLPVRLQLEPLPRHPGGEERPADQGSGNHSFAGHPTPPPAPGGPEGAYALAAQEFLSLAAPFPGGPSGPAPAPPSWRQAVWSQIENTVLQHLQPGRTQVSLTLSPPELGRVELTLELQGQRLLVQALVSRPEVAELAQSQVEQLVQALSRQRLILSQFQVQMPPLPGTAVAAATPSGRPGFRRPEDGPPHPRASRPRGPRGVDVVA